MLRLQHSSKSPLLYNSISSVLKDAYTQLTLTGVPLNRHNYFSVGSWGRDATVVALLIICNLSARSRSSIRCSSKLSFTPSHLQQRSCPTARERPRHSQKGARLCCTAVWGSTGWSEAQIMYAASRFMLLERSLPKSCFRHLCIISIQPRMVIRERQMSDLTDHVTSEVAWPSKTILIQETTGNNKSGWATSKFF